VLSTKTYLKITKLIFAGVGLAHLLRLLFGWTIVIGGWMVPMWLSILGVVAAWYLAYNGFKLWSKK
jgi:hypothetical protein